MKRASWIVDVPKLNSIGWWFFFWLNQPDDDWWPASIKKYSRLIGWNDFAFLGRCIPISVLIDLIGGFMWTPQILCYLQCKMLSIIIFSFQLFDALLTNRFQCGVFFSRSRLISWIRRLLVSSNFSIYGSFLIRLIDCIALHLRILAWCKMNKGRWI